MTTNDWVSKIESKCRVRFEPGPHAATWVEMETLLDFLGGLKLVDPASVVTLDPNNPDDVQRLADAIKANPIGAWPSVAEAALRSLLPTPPLPEPNGLGAVVLTGKDTGREVLRRGEDGWHIVVDVAGPDVPTAYVMDPRDRVVSHGVGCTCGGPGCLGGDQ